MPTDLPHGISMLFEMFKGINMPIEASNGTTVTCEASKGIFMLPGILNEFTMPSEILQDAIILFEMVNFI